MLQSGDELLVENPLFKIVLGVEQEAELPVVRGAHGYPAYVAHFGVVADGADRPLARLEDVERDPDLVRQERAAGGRR